jgi:hypothetical protein
MDHKAPFLRHRFPAFAAAAVACLLISVLTVKLWYHKSPPSITTQSVAVRRTLDLSDYGTYRGEQAPSLPALSLPASLVKLKLILPRFSDPGNYFVMVAPDRSGRNRIAGAKAVATGADPRTLLTVTLDLRNAEHGKYVLATEREGEGGPYFYPLMIEPNSGR